MINNINAYTHILGSGTTQIVTGRATLVAVNINTTSTGAVTVYDSITAGTLNTIAVYKSSIAEQSIPLGGDGITVAFGIQVVCAGPSGDYTIVWRKQ